MSNPFYGLIPAMMTPFTANDTIDEEAIDRLAKWVTRDGVNTLFVLGYCGECFTLSREERYKVISLARKSVGPDKKMIAGVMGNSTKEILTYANDAAEAGADYVLATPTNFLIQNDRELKGLFTDIADNSPLPLVIYNCPENVQTLHTDVIAELSKHENIVAMKQTSDHIELEEMLIATEKSDNFTMISGNEYCFMASLGVGVKSFIMGGPGNILPQNCVRIINKYQSGDCFGASKDYMHMLRFLMELYALPGMAESIIKGVMELYGLSTRWMRKPTISASDAILEDIKRLIDKHQITID